MEIKVGGGISTAIAADMATELTVGTFSGIFEQIDPARIGETQRANMIAFAYGERLADFSKNLDKRNLATLLYGYPDHSFVIDRKEARSIFENVNRPSKQLIEDYIDYFDMFNGDLAWRTRPAVVKMMKKRQDECRLPEEDSPNGDDQGESQEEQQNGND